MTPATCADIPTAANAAHTDAPAPTRVVVVGNGMVGHRLCAQLTDPAVAPANTHAASSPASTPTLSITVLGQEPHPAYNRVHLGELFDNQDALAKLTLGDHAWYATRGIELRTSTQVQHIDTQAKCLRTHDGQTIPYDTLVLATGSRPFVPPIDGANLPGVFVYRTVQDVVAMRQAASQARSCAVIGGGLLGLEAARSIHELGPHVTVLQAANALMPRQLDAAGSQILKSRLQQLGIDIRLQAQTRSITPGSLGKGPLANGAVGSLAPPSGGSGGGGSGSGGLMLRFEGDRHAPLTVDMVVVAAGIRPRDELARQAGLAIGAAPGGIVVNDHLQTSDPDIFALGECARHRGTIHGLVAPGHAMADVLAKRLLGDTQAAFTEGDASTRLKIAGATVAVMGQFDADDARSVSVHRAGMQRTLILRNNRLIGATVVGDWDQLPDLQTAVGQEKLVSSRRLKRFQKTGDLFANTQASLPVIQWPDDRLVCNCLKVCKGTLCQAIAKEQASPLDANGASRICSVQRLGQCTGAGTVCGSCQPLLAELVGADPTDVKKPKATTALLVTCLLALVAAVLIAVLKPLPMAESFQDAWYQFDRIWRVGWVKQLTGYSLLGVAVLGMVLSLRKHVGFLKKLGDLGWYRLLHTVLGLLCLVGLVVHTGMHLGHNLNFALMVCFLGLNAVGAVAGIATALEAKSQHAWAHTARRFRPWLTWAHILFFWPLPVLVGFHIAAVYLY